MNCKKRKLNYIREKNHYRLFGFGSNFIKVSQELLDDPEYVQHLIESSLIKVEKKYKMKFEIIEMDIGFNGLDFIRNLKTIRYKFKKIKES